MSVFLAKIIKNVFRILTSMIIKNSKLNEIDKQIVRQPNHGKNANATIFFY